MRRQFLNSIASPFKMSGDGVVNVSPSGSLTIIPNSNNGSNCIGDSCGVSPDSSWRSGGKTTPI